MWNKRDWCRCEGGEQVSHQPGLVLVSLPDHSLILAINQIALAEGLALGRSLGIDPLLLHQVINSSSGERPSPIVMIRDLTLLGQSWSSRINSPLAEAENSPGSRGFKGGFQSRLMLKVSRASHHRLTYLMSHRMSVWLSQRLTNSTCPLH